MISDTLMSRLRSLTERREEVEHLLGDPDVLGNQDQFRALSMEHHELTPIVESYAAYTQSLDDIESAKSMLSDDDEDIRALNRDYRGRDSATNVLSFALGDETGSNNQLSQQPQGVPKLLGDVVTAFETCAKEAEVQNKMLADHLRHMVVHGVLHLLGYDHQSDDDAQLMENLEREILAGLGVADPYARDAA